MNNSDVAAYIRTVLLCFILISAHDDILEFVTTPRHELPWAKRCVNVNQKLWDETSDNVKDEILKGIARGDIWLAKIRYDQHGRRIFANVCLGSIS